MSKNKLYIAAPFFTPEQLVTVQAVEALCKVNGWDCFSPRRDQPQYTKGDGIVAARNVFLRNVKELRACHTVLANIDDFDPGTIWEMGFAFNSTTVIAFTTHDYGLNIMLAMSCSGFLKGLDEVDLWLRGALEARAWKGECI